MQEIQSMMKIKEITMVIYIGFIWAPLFKLIQCRWATLFSSTLSKWLYIRRGTWWKKTKNFIGSGRRSSLVCSFLLEDCDWLKCREDFVWLVNEVGKSLTVSMSGWSSNSETLLNNWNFDDPDSQNEISESNFDQEWC